MVNYPAVSSPRIKIITVLSINIRTSLISVVISIGSILSPSCGSYSSFFKNNTLININIKKNPLKVPITRDKNVFLIRDLKKKKKIKKKNPP